MGQKELLNIIKRLPFSLIVVFCVFLFLIASPSTQFNRAEASDRIFSNGSRLNLDITDTGSVTQIFQLHNVAPGDSGEGIGRLVNAGELAGELSISFSEVRNTPGTTGDNVNSSGYLSANIEIAIYIDVDASGDWNGGDTGLRSDSTTYSFPTDLYYDYLENYGGICWERVMIMNASDVNDFVILWRVPITVGNESQGSSLDFDIIFLLEQET